MNGLPILMYHALEDSGSVLATSPRHFAATLSALHADGFRCVDLAEWVAEGRPEVARGFAVTFDDGLASIVRAAEPLARFGFSATAFLVTGRMGRTSDWSGGTCGFAPSGLIGWGDLAALRSAGFRFGAHTVTHPRLSRIGDDAMAEEIRGSRADVEQRTGEPCRLFAYPYGDAPRAARELVAREFDAGFGTRLDLATDRQARAFLARVDAYYLRTPRALKGFLSGRWVARLPFLRAGRRLSRLLGNLGTHRFAAAGRLSHAGGVLDTPLTRACRPSLSRREGAKQILLPPGEGRRAAAG